MQQEKGEWLCNNLLVRIRRNDLLLHSQVQGEQADWSHATVCCSPLNKGLLCALLPDNLSTYDPPIGAIIPQESCPRVLAVQVDGADLLRPLGSRVEHIKINGVQVFVIVDQDGHRRLGGSLWVPCHCWKGDLEWTRLFGSWPLRSQVAQREGVQFLAGQR